MPNFYQTLPAIFTLFLMTCCSTILVSQVYNIDDEDGNTVRSCTGRFYDSGGSNGRYRNSEDYTVTFCADAANPGKSARLTFQSLDLRNNDELTFYDGPTTNSPFLQRVDDGSNNIVPFAVSATRNNESGCLTVEFSSNFIRRGDGWLADLSCIERCQVIQAELVSTDPPVMPNDTGWVNACMGQEITFVGRGIFPQEGRFYSHANSSRYFWDFGDGSPRKEGREVTHTYTESGGYMVQLTIQDQVGCLNINNIDQRVRISPKPEFTVQDTPQFCSGDTLDLTGSINGANSNALINVTAQEGTFQPRYTRSDSLFLPDGKGVAYETSVNITEFASGQILENIDDLLGICINIEHSYMRDLQASIECPNGTEVILQNFVNDNRTGSVFLGEPIDVESDLTPGVGYNYCWTSDTTNLTWFEYDRANRPRTLPEGDYRSFSSLDSLIGCPLNGAWTITIEDFLLRDNGYIFDWTISFNPDLYPTLESFKADITDFSWEGFDNNQAALNSAGQNPVTFSVVDEFGCTFDTTIVVQALPPTHPDCYTCQPLLSQAEDLTYCEEESQSLNVGAANLDQIIQFDAFPNYDQLNGDDHSTNSPFQSELDINSIFPTTLEDVSNLISVCINIESGEANPLSDISVALQAPDGTIVQLVSNNGGSGMGYEQTCFSPAATTPIQSATPPYTGTFAAAGDWNALNGVAINGTWSLLVSDREGATNSTVESWSLSFNAQNDITYTWSPSAGLSCSDCPNPDVLPTNDITNIYTVQAQDQYNCSSLDTIQITNISKLEVPNLNCESVDRILAIDWDAQSDIDYEISINGSNWFAPETNISHAVNGLRDDDEVSIQIRPILEGLAPICEIPTNDTLCVFDGCELELMLTNASLDLSCFDSNDGMVELLWEDGIGPFTYSIEEENVSTDNTTFRADDLSAGEYQFVVQDADECTDTVTFVIDAPPMLELEAVLQHPECNNDPNGLIELEANGGTPNYTYSLDGIIFESTAVFAGLTAGVYEVIVKDENDCEYQQEIELLNPEALVVEIKKGEKEDFIAIEYGDEVQLFTNLINAQGNVTYEWTALSGDSTISCLDCPSPLVQPISTTYYELEVIDENGCKSSDRVQVRVVRTFKHYVPTAFSPNEDGNNERLTVYSDWDATIKQFQVFDRWGGLLYSASDFPANDEMAGWNGYDQNGDLMPIGAYVWFAEIEYNDGTKKLYSGSTTLMK
ncbi:MAG: proprotein convertase P-domain-containing protein [Bacteroidota bacterium]